MVQELTAQKDEKESKVYITDDEVRLQGTPLTGLVDRVVANLDRGAKAVDVQFPSIISACDWCAVTEFRLPDGTTDNIRPIEIIRSSLIHRGYNVSYQFGGDVPHSAIRIFRTD